MNADEIYQLLENTKIKIIDVKKVNFLMELNLTLNGLRSFIEKTEAEFIFIERGVLTVDQLTALIVPNCNQDKMDSPFIFDRLENFKLEDRQYISIAFNFNGVLVGKVYYGCALTEIMNTIAIQSQVSPSDALLPVGELQKQLFDHNREKRIKTTHNIIEELSNDPRVKKMKSSSEIIAFWRDSIPQIEEILGVDALECLTRKYLPLEL